ncbi:osmosensitive K+ channel histidine kinase [Longilinea arvoryzae]|uniref:histidine kinase n=1 Tax=Longilinea arvoryzae TaxID=360412 RepID=A0A0S7BIJ1_9CHLR|nr:sensor histidine kinase KdpD [Longilinea arvoryzae]GAP13681.1 osmosensitive K+ channel histidine kinase [Longilinea arvoryzae]
MTEDFKRPNPDELLARLQSEEAHAKRGKLKIFLGYVAGVGKTYAMLEAAHERRDEGVDVVVGYVETHGRKETEGLLSGLEVIPRHETEYRGIRLTEMDLDAVIERHPQIVLVDELAHTNNPGSRHPKRYQDVEEILNAGIDVYSTVNIQHLESLSDVVQQITGVSVREKIPDRVIDEADEIELIDLPTDELLKRLKDGKVYISDQAMRALQKFFREGNLTALRELSLRRAADRVDSQMLSYMQRKAIAGPWPAGDRILVCISSHPMGERLIRSGRRLADELNAEWYVLFVETPQHLHMPVENRIRVQRFLNLAEELGAKVDSVSGNSVAETVLNFAREHNVTKIVAGKPLRSRWYELLRGSVIDQIIRNSGTIDVHVVSDVAPTIPMEKPKKELTYKALWRYGLSILLLIGVTVFGKIIFRFLDPTNLIMVYLLAVVISAVYLGRGPAILASVISVLVFDFFFINPIFSFTVNDTQYLLTFFGLLIVGLIISNSAALLRDQVNALRNKERQAQVFLTLSHELTGAVSLDQVVEIATRSISSILDSKSVILLPEKGNLVSKFSSEGLSLDENELAMAEWSYKHAQSAGQGTDTLPAAAMRFVPLRTTHGSIGVIGIKPDGTGNTLTSEKRMILEGLSHFIAQAVERVNLVDAATQSEMLRNTEKLQSALLNSISHELRTPLASITGVLTSLGESEKSPKLSRRLDTRTKIELLDSATDQARQLNLLVENLLNMTRLEAGSVRLNIGLCDLQDLVGSVVQQFTTRLMDHPLDLEIPDDLPIINCDAIFIAQVISNLLDNACKYSPSGSPITIGVTRKPEDIEIFIRDQGIGIPESELGKVFSKFYRGSQHNNTTGTGLGLSICKGIVEAHGGWIRAEKNPDQGMTFRFSLPCKIGQEGRNE